MEKNGEFLKNCALSEERILQDLQDLSSYYKDMDIESRVIPALEDAPLPTLVALLEMDEQERVRALMHSFLPLDQEDAEFTKYLQFYTELQNSLAGIERITLLEAVCRLNGCLPFGCCMLMESRPELALPSMVSLRAQHGFRLKDPIDQGVFTETVFLFDTSCDLVSSVMDALAAGKTVEDAFAPFGY